MCAIPVLLHRLSDDEKNCTHFTTSFVENVQFILKHVIGLFQYILKDYLLYLLLSLLLVFGVWFAMSLTRASSNRCANSLAAYTRIGFHPIVFIIIKLGR